MSALICRRRSDFAPYMTRTQQDTFMRLGYVAPRGVDVGDVFELPRDWHRELPLRSPVKALSRRQAYERLRCLIEAGWLEVSGTAARLKLPGMVPILGAVRAAGRFVSAVVKSLIDGASTLADFAGLVSSSRRGRAQVRRGSCGFDPASDGFLIENTLREADGEGTASPAPSGGAAVPLSAGIETETGSAATVEVLASEDRVVVKTAETRAEMQAAAEWFVDRCRDARR